MLDLIVHASFYPDYRKLRSSEPLYPPPPAQFCFRSNTSLTLFGCDLLPTLRDVNSFLVSCNINFEWISITEIFQGQDNFIEQRDLRLSRSSLLKMKRIKELPLLYIKKIIIDQIYSSH